MKYYFICRLIKSKQISIENYKIEMQYANKFTKSLSSSIFIKMHLQFIFV